MSEPLPRIVLLTHAPTDLALLAAARSQLPSDFAPLAGHDLQALQSRTDEQGQPLRTLATLLRSELASAQVIVLRVLGRLGAVSGVGELLRVARAQGRHLILLSGTGEPDAELAAASTVAADVQQQALAYFNGGGSVNLAQLLRYLSDRLLLSGYGYEPAQALPEHGLYHPDLEQDASLDDWLALRASAPAGKPAVGIIFYRAHWLSGNTAFIDALVAALEARGMDVLPVFTSSLRVSAHRGADLPPALAYFARGRVDLIINTTSFAMGEITAGGVTPAGWSVSVLEQLDRPVLQAITSGMTQDQWQHSTRGMNPLDAAMNVVLPEFDGRIIGVPLSFKHTTDSGVVQYQALPDRVRRLAGLAQRLVRLRCTPNAQKRIAFIFTNSSSKAAQIGNAVGLDAPESLMAVLRALAADGYAIGELPATGTALIHELVDRCSYDDILLTEDQLRRAAARIPAARYAQWFAALPAALQTRMQRQWGAAPGQAYVHDQHLVIAGLDLGNAFVALQPPRGYGMDPDAIYHQPDLPPTHHYYALYRWLDEEWGADAIVHVGKHGTLEWLPGKGVGLSEECFPDALLGDVPLFYPFIINDPGEGSQAKRRAHAVVVDHLTPPMTTADSYGALAQLTQLVDEYYQVEVLDPAKLPLLQQQIWELVRQTNLESDLQYKLLHHDHDHHHHGHHHHDDHHHPHDHAHEDGTLPHALTELDGAGVAHLIEDLDGYLCELGAAQIRDGLHILGRMPDAAQLPDMLVALTRLPNQDLPGLQEEVARLFGLSLDMLLEHKGRRLNIDDALARTAGRAIVTRADALEAIDALCLSLMQSLQQQDFAVQAIDGVIQSLLAPLFTAPVEEKPRLQPTLQKSAGSVLGGMRAMARPLAPQKRAAPVATIKPTDTRALGRILAFTCEQLAPRLQRTHEEIGNLLNGLRGGYIPAGPSGSPTRGMAHILPTGRNFYSVDPRSVPSQSAWRVGQQLAREVLQRHHRESGDYPESVAISIWGTSAMRTHGDDVAQILSLMGARPVWREGNRHVAGVELVPLEQLQRPRIDVTTRISGFFRDAFPQLIELIDDAVQLAIAADEPEDMNFVRKHYLRDLQQAMQSGLGQAEAAAQASYRVFGAKPGSYGAGILPLIQERNWQDQADFAEAYINWGGYAYGRKVQGTDQREAFRQRLSGVQVALHNQDNREHDLFDSDDYLQYHGGMIATIRALSGQQPRHYFGDSHDPQRAAVRDLKEETLRVFRARVVNPKWLASIRRHGYKGGLELTATVDYLFGYDATAQVLEDWMYQQLAESYGFDPAMREFLEQANPWAQNAIAERLLEAASRGMWQTPAVQTLEQLRTLYLHSEALLEARGETVRGSEHTKDMQ
ncbi:cobaltochelatase subunit CobN [Herbaspirillum sp. C9C3]|uniref:cobaltochelatase subunit CobN n=1 Tax=Herbaspirillum sp. C9C3 TaxID=2735271 RepID=UPI001584B0AD|nr:cobaltochelatase subunit CobN [Herbaspirillum sp. C9C3]NUT61829.1 cobaltochelatase subunit CobN [Herbaspirillum sp. C9C3]